MTNKEQRFEKVVEGNRFELNDLILLALLNIGIATFQFIASFNSLYSLEEKILFFLAIIIGSIALILFINGVTDKKVYYRRIQ